MLQLAQAYLLIYVVLRDANLDGEPRAAEEFPDLLPAQFEAQLRLSLLYGARHHFWTHYRRLVAQQVRADRWEQSATRPVRLDAGLVRRLGRKATLLCWPAAAVALRVGAPIAALRVERCFDELLEALQLLDDVADAEHDAAAGQVNAVLAAGGAPTRASGIFLQIYIARGIPAVFSAIRARLGRLSRLTGGIGKFSRELLHSCGRAERRALEAAHGRAALAFLSEMLPSQERALRNRMSARSQ